VAHLVSTFWSVTQTSGKRETTASGIGWELFRNYLIAKDKFKPDFFLYENNQSAAPAIQKQISTELGVPLQYIDSVLVSAQSRKRFYAHNFGGVPQPRDRNIFVKDIIENGSKADRERTYLLNLKQGAQLDALDGDSSAFFKLITMPSLECELLGDFQSGGRELLTSNQTGHFIHEPIRVGVCETLDGKYSTAQGNRVYSVYGKSVTLLSGGGGKGAKTGLYTVPTNRRGDDVYRVRNGSVTQDGVSYPIRLPDGDYLVRRLTTTEACRLQTLPDDYFLDVAGKSVVSTQQLYRGAGNGWTAEVIVHLLKHGLRDVPRDEPLLILSMFDGISTGQYCLEKLGFTNVEYHAYEIDANAIKVTMNRYPDTIQHGDAFAVRDEGWCIQ
jgi:DNA (cytosine-5)-methyltransferase 3A